MRKIFIHACFISFALAGSLMIKDGSIVASSKALDSRPRGRRFEPHQGHCVVSLSKNINPSLVLVQPRKTRLFIPERLVMGGKESNQNKQTFFTGLANVNVRKDI